MFKGDACGKACRPQDLRLRDEDEARRREMAETFAEQATPEVLAAL